jgi:hypothetical protein
MTLPRREEAIFTKRRISVDVRIYVTTTSKIRKNMRNMRNEGKERLGRIANNHKDIV